MQNKNFNDYTDLNYLKQSSKKVGNSKLTSGAVDEQDPFVLEQLNNEIKKAVSKDFGDELLREKVLNAELSEKVKKYVIDYLNENNYTFKTPKNQLDFIEQFIINFTGYGILQPLMDNEDIEEIFVLAHDRIYIGRNGKIELTNVKFADEPSMVSFVDNLLSLINKQVNRRTPIVDGRLADGSRIAISDGSLSGSGAALSFNIRKFKKTKITTADLVRFKTMNKEMEDFLKMAVGGYLNIVVSGGTSSGKTTLLNAIAQYMSDEDFIITLEDNLELQLDKELWLQLESRQSNLEGEGEISMFDLQKHTLRRSPGRIIVGEVRDGAVADSLYNAVSTGHDGVMCTVHANDPNICRKRMSKLAASYNKQTMDESIDDFNSTFDLIVQIKRFKGLARRVITNITYVDDNGKLVDIFRYDKEKDKWTSIPVPTKITEKIAYNS